MPELVFVIKQNKTEVMDALKIKAALERRGMKASGMFMVRCEEQSIPPQFIEALLGLKTVGFVKEHSRL